jgi:hypothetical protein
LLGRSSGERVEQALMLAKPRLENAVEVVTS